MTYYFGFVILALVIAYLIKAMREKEIRRWGIATTTLAVAATLAVCANLPSLYHTSKYAKETQREQSEIDNSNPEEADAAKRSYLMQYSYGRETFTLLIPDVKGGSSLKPLEGGLDIMSLAKARRRAEIFR